MSQASPDAMLPYTSPELPSGEFVLDARGRRNPETWLKLLTGGSALVILMMLASLLVVLTWSAWPSIRTFGWHFVVSSDWRPNELEQPKTDANGNVITEDGEVVMETIPPAFGALPVIFGTVVSSLIALLFAVPLSLGTALFFIRIAPRWLVAPVSFLVEFLAAIPSIAYGLWGLFILAPFLQRTLEPWLNRLFASIPGLSVLHTAGMTTGRDMFCGGVILAIMIVPIITAISRDVLSAVPRAQVEGSIALGATWWQSAKEMLKYSRSGLFGAVMLGLARAAGETMAVTMVIGNNNQIRLSPFAPAQTMASLLANEFAEASSDIHRAALAEVALILLAMSLVFNVVARYLVVGKGARTAAAH